jgi:acyl carrier protein
MSQDPRIREVLVRLLAIELGVPPGEIIAAASLREDVGMDSIAAANLLFSLEEELGVEFDEIPRIETLDELEVAVREFLGAGERRGSPG